ncbi:hypothetical protein niasHT_024380 [Heterodera trifolii]|uniref:RRM domain-containing protein n=1 Tax=Heterodera trifolii TaxID=157864 RepID=A0ABD2JY92_9BILA
MPKRKFNKLANAKSPVSPKRQQLMAKPKQNGSQPQKQTPNKKGTPTFAKTQQQKHHKFAKSPVSPKKEQLKFEDSEEEDDEFDDEELEDEFDTDDEEEQQMVKPKKGGTPTVAQTQQKQQQIANAKSGVPPKKGQIANAITAVPPKKGQIANAKTAVPPKKEQLKFEDSEEEDEVTDEDLDDEEMDDEELEDESESDDEEEEQMVKPKKGVTPTVAQTQQKQQQIANAKTAVPSKKEQLANAKSAVPPKKEQLANAKSAVPPKKEQLANAKSAVPPKKEQLKFEDSEEEDEVTDEELDDEEMDDEEMEDEELEDESDEEEEEEQTVKPKKGATPTVAQTEQPKQQQLANGKSAVPSKKEQLANAKTAVPSKKEQLSTQTDKYKAIAAEEERRRAERDKVTLFLRCETLQKMTDGEIKALHPDTLAVRTNNRAFCWMVFASEPTADKAFAVLSKKGQIGGKELYVDKCGTKAKNQHPQKGTKKEHPISPTQLAVFHFPPSTTADQLKVVFPTAKDVKIDPFNLSKNSNKSFRRITRATITFGSETDAKKAFDKSAQLKIGGVPVDVFYGRN